MTKKELELHLWKTVVPEIPQHQTNRDLIVPDLYKGLDTLLQTYNIKSEFRCAGAAWDSVFNALINEIKPQVIIEVGSYVGYSAIRMAEMCKDAKLEDVAIICIDPWLDATARSDYEARIHGYPSNYFRFLNNVKTRGQEDTIIPFPMPALTAYKYLQMANIKADMIYIDGSHDYDDAYLDFSRYINLVKEGGVIFGDDWTYEGVKSAIHDVCSELSISLPTIVPGTAVWYVKI